MVMPFPTAATQHYNSQRRIAASTLRSSKRLWRRVGTDFDAGWALIAAELNALVADAMREAAEGGIAYVPKVLAQTSQPTAGLATVSAAAFVGWTREGLPVDEVLHASVRVAKQAIASGASPAGAAVIGGRSLDRVVTSVIADADRQAVQVTLTPTRVGGYVRMVRAGACRRCIVLAGRWYAWNEGFERHPNCNCRHIPASEDRAGDWSTDPYEMFHSMSPEEQERVFGRSEARAIRDGADIFRVVNTERRGLPGPRAHNAPRLTVDEIYRTAGTRSNAVRMLTEQGYILPGGQQREGVIGYGDLGLDSKGAHYFGSGALGRGGTRTGAAYVHRLAATTGRRDPLARETMTAAERRLNDAVLAARAVAEGRNPYGTYKLTDAGRKRAVDDLAFEIDKLRRKVHPRQVHTLADMLGVLY
jgi:hypothetical protein